ncbi:MAG: hypothetical protein C0613_06660 [Desulfobulbaceae bacterium]|nr:MAG: hypothetical protein C0613_06660 [Desulfobulbaceae bacterium]
MSYPRVFGIWLLILLCAVANGAFRQAVLLASMPRAVAYVLSGVLLCACVLGIAFLLIPRLGPLSARHHWKIGACWLTLTLLFEFGFGALVAGMSRQELLNAYTFQEGNIWPLVLLVIFIAPRLVGHLQGCDEKHNARPTA